MDSWLRPVFSRRSTPALPESSWERASKSFLSEDYEGEDARLRANSRASQLSQLTNSPPSDIPDLFPISVGDTVWNKPSADQLVEMLKVAMMTQNNLDPLPVHYNACILHVLEAYYELKIEKEKLEEEVVGLREMKEHDIKDIKELGDEWALKERHYQGEIKRLEIMLSKAEGSLDGIMLARSKSVIHRSKNESKVMVDRIATMVSRHESGHRRDTKPYQGAEAFSSSSFPTGEGSTRHNDKLTVLTTRDSSDPFRDVQLPRTPQHNRRNHVYSTERSRSSGDKTVFHNSGFTAAQLEAIDKGIAKGETQLEALERHQASEERRSERFNIPSEDRKDERRNTVSSSSSGLPDWSSDEDETTTDGSQNSGRFTSTVPASHDTLSMARPLSRNTRAHSATLDRFFNSELEPLSEDTSELGPRQMSFSFRPGDDSVLARMSMDNNRPKGQNTSTPINRNIGDGYDGTSPSGRGFESDTELADHQPIVKHVSAIPKSTSKGNIPSPRIYDTIRRENSGTSSVITAIRDNSARSSVSSHREQPRARPNLKSKDSESKNGSSNRDAVTAATRAVAAKSANNRKQKKHAELALPDLGQDPGSFGSLGTTVETPDLGNDLSGINGSCEKVSHTHSINNSPGLRKFPSNGSAHRSSGETTRTKSSSGSTGNVTIRSGRPSLPSQSSSGQDKTRLQVQRLSTETSRFGSPARSSRSSQNSSVEAKRAVVGDNYFASQSSPSLVSAKSRPSSSNNTGLKLERRPPKDKKKLSFPKMHKAVAEEKGEPIDDNATVESPVPKARKVPSFVRS